MFGAVDVFLRSFEFDPLFSRSCLDPKFLLHHLEVPWIVVVKLLRDACAFEVQSLVSHFGFLRMGDLGESTLASGADAACKANSALNLAATSRRASGSTCVPANTGMKLVSPFQRGTMCTCKWPRMPAPATRPRLMPMLKTVGPHDHLHRCLTTSQEPHDIRQLLICKIGKVLRRLIRNHHQMPPAIGKFVQ